jgi:hypothetical protein
MPLDQGQSIIEYALTHNRPLIGSSDVSFIDGVGPHAWILTTDETTHMDNPEIQLGAIQQTCHLPEPSFKAKLRWP